MKKASRGKRRAGSDAPRPAKRRKSNDFEPPYMAPALNLVLFGRRGAEKTKAVKAILGQADLHPVSSSSDCVKHQAEVHGRRLTLVKLPSLSGERPETVMESSIRCVSDCHPEGVHAFIQVLPVGPLTDEDKEEFETIQKTFGSQVQDFTMFLFTSESDPSSQANVKLKKDKDIQEFTKRCKGGCFVLNIRDKQQIPELIKHVVEKIQEDEEKPCSYTYETLLRTQMEKINTLQGETQDQKGRRPVSCEGESQTPESLRIVLLGKTGSGKSSSGNTILGRKVFEAKAMQTSVTRHCKKAHGEVNGRQVTVVDTPGLFDSTLSDKEIHEEMLQCISLLAPGPHVFLLVLRIDRFTLEQRETIKLIREGFGRGADKFSIILFTGGDTLRHSKMSIDEYIKGYKDESFKDLISDCGGRYHLFNNLDDKDQTQVSELITKIDEMKRNSCFTNEMLEEAEDAIQTNMRRLLKEKEEEMEIKKKDLEKKHMEAMKEMKERNERQIVDIEEKRKLGEKQLREMEENIKKEHSERQRDQSKREREEQKRKQQEESRRRQLEKKLADLEQQIQTKQESKEAVDKELQETQERMKNEKEEWEVRQRALSEKRENQYKLRQQREQDKLKDLQEEYEREKKENERKRKEEDRIRREEEENERKAAEKSRKEKEYLKRTYEEEARQKAEKLNEFKEKYKRDFEAKELEHDKQIKTKEKQYNILKALAAKNEEQLKKKHQHQIRKILKLVTQKREGVKEINDLQKKQEEEMNKQRNEAKKRQLWEKHEKEMDDLIEKLMNQEGNTFMTWIRKWF